MIKRLKGLSLLVLLAMVLSTITIVPRTHAAGTLDEIIQEFDGTQTPEELGWATSNSGSGDGVSIENGALKITKGGSTSLFTAGNNLLRNLKPAKRYVVEYRYKLPTANNTDVFNMLGAIDTVRADGTTVDNGNIYVYETASKWMILSVRNATKGYVAYPDMFANLMAATGWVDVKCVIDVGTNADSRFTYYVNGSTRAEVNGTFTDHALENLRFKTNDDVAGLNNIYFQALSTTRNSSIYVDYFRAYADNSMNVVSASPVNNATSVGLNSPITIVFDKDIDSNTLDGITLTDSSNNVVPINASASGKTVTVIPVSTLNNLTTYTLTVTNAVKSLEGNALKQSYVTTFTTIDPTEDTLIFNENFLSLNGATFSHSDNTITGVNTEWGYFGGNKGRAGVAFDSGLQKYILNHNYVTVSETPYYYPYFHRDKINGVDLNTSNLQGVIQLESKFILTANTAYYPVSFTANGGDRTYYYDFMQLLKFTPEGSIVASTPNVTDITANGYNADTVTVGTYNTNTWYDLKIILNVDGDPATFDTYQFVLSDGTNTYTGGPYKLGVSMGNTPVYNRYNFTGITRLIYGLYGSSTLGNSSMADLKLLLKASPQIVSSINDGAENFAVDGAVTLDFNMDMNAETFSNIKVLRAGQDIGARVSPLAGNVRQCTVSFDEPLKYGKQYTLLIPTSVASAEGAGVVKKVINFSTEPMPADIRVENVVINDGGAVSLAEGATIKVSAKFTNAGIKNPQNSALIVALYDSNGIMKTVAYTSKPLALGASDTVIANLTVPQSIGANPKIKIFAWDDFSLMTPMSETYTYPEQ